MNPIGVRVASDGTRWNLVSFAEFADNEDDVYVNDLDIVDCAAELKRAHQDRAIRAIERSEALVRVAEAFKAADDHRRGYLAFSRAKRLSAYASQHVNLWLAHHEISSALLCEDGIDITETRLIATQQA